MRRRAQIITPKDAIALLHLAGVGPGGRVAEAGSGSGGLTLFLAHAVGAEGRVVSYDLREDHQRTARENLERAGFSGRVEFRIGDVRQGVPDQGLDAWVLDLPDPWESLGPLLPSLRVGGHLAAYVPTYNQLERTVREMRSRGLVEVRAEELLERALHVGEGGTRPETEMLGHTGFLAAGRKVA
jgi:tRNA (adenine57-N1/adenine58-N1)-methyltransferase